MMSGLIQSVERLPSDDLGNEVWRVDSSMGVFQFTISKMEWLEMLKHRDYLLGRHTDEQLRNKLFSRKIMMQIVTPRI